MWFHQSSGIDVTCKDYIILAGTAGISSSILSGPIKLMSEYLNIDKNACELLFGCNKATMGDVNRNHSVNVSPEQATKLFMDGNPSGNPRGIGLTGIDPISPNDWELRLFKIQVGNTEQLCTYNELKAGYNIYAGNLKQRVPNSIDVLEKARMLRVVHNFCPSTSRRRFSWELVAQINQNYMYKHHYHS